MIQIVYQPGLFFVPYEVIILIVPIVVFAAISSFIVHSRGALYSTFKLAQTTNKVKEHTGESGTDSVNFKK